jgi:hypothetical protein
MIGGPAEQIAQASFFDKEVTLLLFSLFFLSVLCVESLGVEST